LQPIWHCVESRGTDSENIGLKRHLRSILLHFKISNLP
jgi:hypothetical protein